MLSLFRSPRFLTFAITAFTVFRRVPASVENSLLTSSPPTCFSASFIVFSIPHYDRRTLISTFNTILLSFFKSYKASCSLLLNLLNLSFETPTFISFSSKLRKYGSIAASLLRGLNLDLVLNMSRRISLFSIQKCHFKRSI